MIFFVFYEKKILFFSKYGKEKNFIKITKTNEYNI